MFTTCSHVRGMAASIICASLADDEDAQQFYACTMDGICHIHRSHLLLAARKDSCGTIS